MALLLLPVLLGFALPDAFAPWRWRAVVDAPLALLLALVCGIWAAETAGASLAGAPFTASDFSDYCASVDAALSGEPAAGNQRSPLAARIVALFAARVGVLDGFAIVAVLGLVAIAVGVYLWAHAAGDRLAAVAGVVLVAAFGPVVLLARTPTFYPQLVAASVLASATTAMALRTRGTAWIGLAAAFVGTAPLFDARDALWTFTCAPLLLVAALCAPAADAEGAAGAGGARDVRGARVARRLGRVALVCAILVLGWAAGRLVYPQSYGGTLEWQTWVFVSDMRRSAGLAAGVPMCPGTGLVWGWTDPRGIPDTLACLHTLRAGLPGAAERAWNVDQRWSVLGAPWVPIVGSALVIAAAGLARRPARLLALVAPMLPFVLTAATARDDPHVRRIGAALVVGPVAVGVAGVVLVGAAAGLRGWSRRWPALDLPAVVGRGWWARRLVAAAQRARDLPAPTRHAIGLALAVLAAGAAQSCPGSALAPDVAARRPVFADAEWIEYATGKRGVDAPRRIDAACARRLAADHARGVPAYGVLGTRWDRTRAPTGPGSVHDAPSGPEGPRGAAAAPR
jgi:hypothetical protein